MKKIKVLFVIHSLAGGGAERVMSYILNNLDKEKFYITLITFSDEKKYEIHHYIEHIIIKCRFKKKIFKWCYFFWTLSKIFKLNKYDVIVSFLTHVNFIVIVSWLFSWKKGKLFVCERTNPKKDLNNQNFEWLKHKLISLLYPYANKIITVSKGVKKILIKYYKIPEFKIKVIYNPIDIDKINLLKKEKINISFISQDIPIILTCGRLTKAKNYSLLIKSFYKLLTDSGINALLIIIGDGEEKENLKKLVKELKLEDKVFFLGFQTNPYKYMKRATIFVLSSSWEGFPNVLLEAMACGVPIISTNCPFGPNEIIEDGKNGFLVPVDDEEKLVNAMLKLLKDHNLREKFSYNGKNFSKNFKINKIIKIWENILEEE